MHGTPLVPGLVQWVLVAVSAGSDGEVGAPTSELLLFPLLLGSDTPREMTMSLQVPTQGGSGPDIDSFGCSASEHVRRLPMHTHTGWGVRVIWYKLARGMGWDHGAKS